MGLKNADKAVQAGKDKHLLVVCGPTAIGKTAFGIRLARYFGTVIISADSRQFYREMRIGTAFPEPEELAAARHYFVGNLSVKDAYNVARYEEEVLQLLGSLFQQSDIVILLGGSGLYIDAVCKGIDELPDYDPALRNSLKRDLTEKGLGFLADRLLKLDPEYHAVADLNNPKRVMRALEVCLQSGTTYSSLRKNLPRERPFNIVRTGLNTDREILFKKIDERVEKMMEKGLPEEVRSLLPWRACNALNTVGYKELFAYLEGAVSLEQAVENIKTNTRRYAKRQLTWFKRDQDIKWFGPDEDQRVIDFLREQGIGNS